MSETTHTPTPWKTEDRTHKGAGFTIFSPSAHYSRSNVAHYVSKTDAALIVTAVNAHETMKAALKRAKHELDMAADQLHTLRHVDHAEDIRITIGVLNEALALAEPKHSEPTS